MSIKKRFLSFPTMGAMGMVVVGREMSDSTPFCQIQANDSLRQQGEAVALPRRRRPPRSPTLAAHCL